MTQPLKTRQVNIGSEEKPKYATIGDYWDEEMVRKVTQILHEYQDLFSTKFSEMKGILGDIGVIKIHLKPDAKPDHLSRLESGDEPTSLDEGLPDA